MVHVASTAPIRIAEAYRSAVRKLSSWLCITRPLAMVEQDLLENCTQDITLLDLWGQVELW